MTRFAILPLCCTGCLLAPSPPVCKGTYGTPTKIDELATSEDEDSPWLSRDRLEIVFARPDGGDVQLFRSRRGSVLDPFPPPTKFLVDAGHDGTNPHVTADDLTLWFSSNRATSSVHIATRSTVFDEFLYQGPAPELAGAGAVTLTDDELDIYYDYGSPTDVYHQHRSDRTEPFIEGGDHVVPGLGPLGESRRAPAISSDGTVLLFHTDTELYRATGSGEAFANVVSIGAGAYDASLTDDTAIVFASPRGAAPDLFIMERACP